MAKVQKRAVAYLTLSKNGKAIYVTPVHWDADKRELVFENEIKLYGWRSEVPKLLSGEVKSVALMHSEPLPDLEK